MCESIRGTQSLRTGLACERSKHPALYDSLYNRCKNSSNSCRPQQNKIRVSPTWAWAGARKEIILRSNSPWGFCPFHHPDPPKGQVVRVSGELLPCMTRGSSHRPLRLLTGSPSMPHEPSRVVSRRGICLHAVQHGQGQGQGHGRGIANRAAAPVNPNPGTYLLTEGDVEVVGVAEPLQQLAGAAVDFHHPCRTPAVRCEGQQERVEQGRRQLRGADGEIVPQGRMDVGKASTAPQREGDRAWVSLERMWVKM